MGMTWECRCKDLLQMKQGGRHLNNERKERDRRRERERWRDGEKGREKESVERVREKDKTGK